MKGIFISLALIPFLALSGCNLTPEEKKKLDDAAIDLEKLADQIIITSPAKDSIVEQSIVTVRADIPADAQAKEVALYVDGIEIAKDSDGAPWEIQWPAYYYADGNKHTLLLKTITGSGNEVRNNEQFQLTVAESANQALAFTDGVDGTKIQDQNQLKVSFAEFPGATRYEVTDGLQTVETTSTTATLIDLDVGTYSVRYRAIFDYSASTTLTGPWSASAQIEVLPPQLPVIHDPVVVKNELGYELSFSWESVADGDTYSISLKKSGEVEGQTISSDTDEELNLPEMEFGMYTWALIRTNPIGQTVHSESQEIGVGVFRTQLGGSRHDRASQIIASQSGGYIVRAYTSSYEVTESLIGDSDDWIIRLDENGSVTAEYIENKLGTYRFRDMIEVSEGVTYLVGKDWDTGKALIAKLNSNLEPMWESEVLYRPASVSGSYEFMTMTELDGKLYVSAVEWHDGRRDKAHLHEVNPITGVVSDSIPLPEIPGVKVDSIKSLVPTVDGNLALVGSGKPISENPMEDGVFILVLDSTLNEVAQWNNISDYHHLNAGDAIELASGRGAIIGQSSMGHVSISSVNTDGTEHRYFESSYSERLHYGPATNLIELSDNTLVAFLHKYENGNYSLVLKGFNQDLIPTQTKTLHDTALYTTAYGMVGNTDDSITVLYAEGQDGFNNYDIVIRRMTSFNN